MDLFQWFLKPNEFKKIGFEDMKYAIKYKQCIINTLEDREQECLIYGTIPYDREEFIMNRLMEENLDVTIILYGRNSADETPDKKMEKLKKYGFRKIYIYAGGLFEWLLLQDIYGSQEFPTTSVCKDLLKYRPQPIIAHHVLQIGL